MSLDKDQLQSILDSYSKGKIVNFYPLKETLIEKKNPIVLSKYLVETKLGMFLIVTAPNETLHYLWWSSKADEYPAKLSKPLKLKKSEMLLTNDGTNTVHKFDLRISVFIL